jgi:hypothetical protein
MYDRLPKKEALEKLTQTVKAKLLGEKINAEFQAYDIVALGSQPAVNLDLRFPDSLDAQHITRAWNIVGQEVVRFTNERYSR